MADIGNQLEGVGDGLDRFLDALDSASIKMGSAAAMEAKITREDLRTKKQTAKLEKSFLKGMKDSVKAMTGFNKSIGEMGKGMLKGMAKIGGAAAKAGAIGALVVGVKFLIDGLLKVDKGMADLVKRTKLTRVELAGVKEAALAAEMSIGLMGPQFEQIVAEAGNLVETFGSASMVSDKLIKDSLALQQGYGVAAAEAGKLTEALERTARSGEEFRNSIREIAGKTGVSASLLMRSMAGQAQQIAIQNERSTESMARMAANALKAGVSLSDMQGMKGAFGDIDAIAEGLGKAGAIMGSEFTDALGSMEDLYALNLKGATGREVIEARILKGMKATVKLDKEGNLRMKDTNELLSEMEGYMDEVAKFTGWTTEALILNTRQHIKGNRETAKSVSDAEHLETIYRDQLGVLEYFQKIVTSVFGKITTAFSEALGIDQSEGGVRGLLKKLEGDMENIFQFKTLRRDIASGGGGFGGFVEAMMTRLDPLMEYLKEGFISALSAAFEWIGNNVEVDLSAGLTGGAMIRTKGQIAREGLEQYRHGNLAGPAGVGGFAGNLAGKSGTNMRQLMTTAGFETAQEQAWFAYQVDSQGQSPMQLKKGLYNKEIQQAKRRITGAEQSGFAPGGKYYDPRSGSKQYNDDVQFLERFAPKALGGFGGPSLVGEAGGEVVISRSALRSGVGIGGRAASALAGIGVPGFREGYARADTSGISGRQGLMGAAGSQAFREARGSAFQTEQAQQQASMMEYWRQHYENKMDDMVDEKAKPKEPPWLAKFFLKYNKEIGTQLKKTGPTFSAAIMTGMTNWSKGGSLKESMMLGAKAGITAGLNDPESKLNELLTKMGGLGDVAKAGMTAFAQGKSVKRAVVGAGARSLASYIQGGGTNPFKRKNKEKEMYGSSYSGAAEDLFSDADFGSQGNTVAESPGGYMAAKGKYVNRPTLMMVGEEGRGEVVVPTERIRKGLPINAGVARELGSIGVPGFAKGKGVKGRWGEMEGGMGMAKQGAASALVGFADIYEQTGDWKQAASGGVGQGIGAAAGFGLTALGIPPPLSTMIGSAVGGLATKGINKIFKITGGYGKGRKRSLKLIENHIKSGGRFDFGAPTGLSNAMGLGVGGYEKTPTEANFNKMVEKLGTSRLVASMGVPAPALIALAQGQMGGNQASKMYSTINRSLYGNTPDRYRKALSIPSLAAGGIVNRPTTALIGERGPEAVVPLGNSEMMQELKKQNKLMAEMIQTQKDTAQTEIRMDGRVVSEVVGQNFYEIGNGL